jgi:adenylate cyclase
MNGEFVLVSIQVEMVGVEWTTKFDYDLLGDGLNIAVRLESQLRGGQMNISKHTFELIKDYFQCEYRNQVEIRKRGKIEIYFVVSEK